MTTDSGAPHHPHLLSPLPGLLTARGTARGQEDVFLQRRPGAIDKPGRVLPAPSLFHGTVCLAMGGRPGAYGETSGGYTGERSGFGSITGINPGPYGQYRAIKAWNCFRPGPWKEE